MTVAVVKRRSHRLTFGQVEITVPAGRDTMSALEALVAIGPRLAYDLRTVGMPDVPT